MLTIDPSSFCWWLKGLSDANGGALLTRGQWVDIVSRLNEMKAHQGNLTAPRVDAPVPPMTIRSWQVGDTPIDVRGNSTRGYVLC